MTEHVLSEAATLRLAVWLEAMARQSAEPAQAEIRALQDVLLTSQRDGMATLRCGLGLGAQHPTAVLLGKIVEEVRAR